LYYSFFVEISARVGMTDVIEFSIFNSERVCIATDFLLHLLVSHLLEAR
jgi:hypothetical protein